MKSLIHFCCGSRLGRILRRLSVGLLAVAGMALFAAPTSAAEQSKEFLDALRSRGYFEYAIDYLNWMKTSPLVSAKDRETIGYELGATLVDSLRSINGAKEREAQLARAEAELKTFLDKHKEHSLVDATYGKLSDVNLLRAGERLRAAKNPRADKAVLLAEAEKFYDAAISLLEKRRKRIGKALSKIGAVTQKETGRINLRKKLRSNYIVATLAVARIERFKSRVYEDDDKKFKEQMTKAADAYGKIFTNYPGRGITYIARISQAQCYQELNDPKKALECYADVLALEGEDARGLKTEAYKGAVECWIDDKIKEFDKALDVEVTWLLRASALERRQENWLTLMYALAVAHEKIGNMAPEDKASEKKSELDSALRLATDVAKIPNRNQRNAREMLVRIRKESKIEQPEPTSFAEALERAESEYSAYSFKKLLAAKLEGRIKAEKEGIKELKKQRDDALAAIEPALRRAIKYFKLALQLADRSQEIDEAKRDVINLARYRLCTLLYYDGQYVASAVVGDFLARNYPRSRFGFPGARLALRAWGASLSKMRKADSGVDTSFEIGQITSIAGFITSTWTDPTKTDSAFNMLATIMVSQGKPKEALEYLKKISPDSEMLGSAYVRVGKSLCDQFHVGKKGLKKGEQASPELMDLGRYAKETLNDGIARLASREAVTVTLIHAAFRLAKIYVNTNEPLDAIAILENTKYGPLALIKAKHPSTQAPREKGAKQLEIAVNSLAVRAYVGGIGADPPNTKTYLEKAEAAVTHLESLVSAKELSFEYGTMARELRLQLELAENDRQRSEIAEGFAKFLRKMRDGKGAEEYNTLRYVFAQFTSLAQGSEGNRKKAEGYYKEAIDTGQKIFDLAKAGTFKVSAKNMMGMKIDFGTSLGKLGEYKRAIKMFEEILIEKPNLLSVQMAAAHLYKLRGKDDPKYYSHAIGGGLRRVQGGNKRIIWGYRRIVEVTSPLLEKYPHLKETQHEAQFNRADSQFRAAKAIKGNDTLKQRYLGAAHETIFNVFQGFPKMGGTKWRPQYDALLRKIQKARRTKPVNGLDAFESVSKKRAAAK